MNKRFTTYSLLLFFVFFLLTSCQHQQEEEKIKPLKGPFFNLKPTELPTILEPDHLASGLVEYNGTFSPDGKQFYYTTNLPGKGVITYTELQEDNTWSKPAVAYFSGTYTEYDPLFSPDGKRLYFSSQRPTPDSTENNQSNVWFIEKQDKGWSDPQYIPLTEEADYYSSLTKNGDIYFNVWSKGSIYKATEKDGKYEIEELSEVINGISNVGDPFISPDEDYLIFRGYGKESLGRGDLYISFNLNGVWTKPENLGVPINSKAHEMCPYVTTDGKIFIFASARIEKEYEVKPLEPISNIYAKGASYDNGQLNMYYMSASFIQEMKKKHLEK